MTEVVSFNSLSPVNRLLATLMVQPENVESDSRLLVGKGQVELTVYLDGQPFKFVPGFEIFYKTAMEQARNLAFDDLVSKLRGSNLSQLLSTLDAMEEQLTEALGQVVQLPDNTHHSFTRDASGGWTLWCPTARKQQLIPDVELDLFLKSPGKPDKVVRKCPCCQSSI